jgi:hypothetical protein
VNLNQRQTFAERVIVGSAGLLPLIGLFWLSGEPGWWLKISVGLMAIGGLIYAFLYVFVAVAHQLERDIDPARSERRKTAFQLALAALGLVALWLGNRACESLDRL